MPVDPFEQVTTHRPLDYWGRNLLDHLMRLLPEALADDGVAYLMQLSIIGERRTTQLLDSLGFQARVVDFGFFEFSDLFAERNEQISASRIARTPTTSRSGAPTRWSPICSRRPASRPQTAASGARASPPSPPTAPAGRRR